MNQKKIVSLLWMLGFLFAIAGCGRQSNGAEVEKTEQVEETTEQNVVTQTDKKLVDKDTLYENQDPSSVVTMYLTVSSGNKSDNTDHTWTEVNSYSAYDYDEMGVDRYAVNGLLQVGDEDGPQEGELGYGLAIPNATVTIRGQTSTRYARKNYKIVLRDEKGTWNDQKVINLNKHEQDYARFTNKLCYDLMSELPGMMSLRTQFVHLYVKDTTVGGGGGFVDYGLYTQVEQLNKRALQNHGLDKNGQLYKVNMFEFHQYEDIIRLKSDAAYDEKAFEELLEIKGDDDHSKLIAMLADVNDYSIPITEVLEEWFEEDNILSWMAFHILVGNVDTQSRNTFLYSPLNDNTWYFISWDNDAAFTETKNNIKGEPEGRGWEKGISNYWGNVLFRRILKDDGLRVKLQDKMEEYRGIITEEKLESMVKVYSSVVKEYAFREPDSINMPVTEAEYEQLLRELPLEVERNYEIYLETLEEPMPFFIGIPEKEADGIQLTWDNAYDFDGEDVRYSLELAADYSFDDPIVSEDGLFTPEYTYEGKLEPGQYFVRIKAVNEAGKEQYAFDYYVTESSTHVYGVKCFYVLEDGSIEEDVYEE